MAIRKAKLLRDVPCAYREFKCGDIVEVLRTFTLGFPRIAAEIKDPIEVGTTHLIYEEWIEYIDS